MKSWANIKLFLKLAYHVSPSYLWLLVANALLMSARVLSNVILPKYLIDELLGLGRGDQLLLWGGLLVGANLFFGWLEKTSKRLREVRYTWMQHRMQEEMANRIMGVKYEYLETPYYLDLKERALFAARNQSALEQFVGAITQLIQYSITIAGIVGILLLLSPWMVVVLLIGIVLHLLINRSFKKYQNRFYAELMPINRRYGYYMNLSMDRKIAKDIRLFDMSDLLIQTVRRYNDHIMSEFHTYFHKEGLATGMLRVLQAIQTGIIYLYLSLRVFTTQWGPTISIGSFSMYVSASIQFSIASAGFLDQFVIVNQMLKYLEPFFEFMTLPMEEEEGKRLALEGPITSIRFEHVSFTYPNATSEVLSDVNFEIKQGEKVSIVGLNGAGKTTLIKLLCRLYAPSQGTIYVNDVDLNDYDRRQYLAKLSVVFQDYRLFEYTIQDNIVGSETFEEQRLQETTQQVSLSKTLADLPLGVQTPMDKNINEQGVELSGGQQQKVAIARALYKESSLVILDEPTSALDPLAEAEIYEHFNHLVHDRTAIYISHRMSSSVFCDRVLILDGGTVADYDTHSNLMKKKGSLYYRMFQSQADNYRL